MTAERRRKFDYESALDLLVTAERAQGTSPEELRRLVTQLRRWYDTTFDNRYGVQTELFEDARNHAFELRVRQFLVRRLGDAGAVREAEPDANTSSHTSSEKPATGQNTVEGDTVTAFDSIEDADISATKTVPPPSIFEFALSVVLSRSDREAILGDLFEEYETYAVPRFGRRRAALWYRIQVIRSLGPLAWKRIRAVIKWAAVADMLHRVLSRG